jgi:hypothetical protein
MAECKALRTFNSDRYGFIRAGSHFSSEVGYAQDLVRNGLAQIIVDEPHPTRQVQAFPRAPEIKEQPPDPPPAAANNPVTADPPADGPEKSSLLSRAVRASRRRTANPSED